MAGRYLSLEEAAAQLGLSVDEVQRLVDKKRLYPIRDGGSLKFKSDDVDGFAGELAADAGTSDDLLVAPELDVAALSGLEPIDIGSAAGSGVEAEPLSVIAPVDATIDDSLTLDVEAMIELDQPPAAAPAAAGPPSDSLAIVEPLSGFGSASIAMPADGPASGGPLSAREAPALEVEAEAGSVVDLAAADSAPLVFDQDGLVDSIISASAASLVMAEEPDSVDSPDAGTLEIDLGEPFETGGLGQSGGSLAIGSAAGSGQVGSALSGVLDSGVRIEEKALEIEGVQAWDEVDLGIPDDEADVGDDLGVGGDGVLDDHDFELGAGRPGGDDDSASVVMPTDESEASDFYPSGTDASGFSQPSFGGSIGSAGSLDLPVDMLSDIRFSTWQVAGLICCALVLLIGGLVAFDLVRTIGSPRGTLLANPLLNSLAGIFGWR